MYELVELPTVEETKHLVPNLPIIVSAIFGNDAYLLPKAPQQADWATDKIKIGDGLVWLPWLRQLWLIEVEWKEGSNFFDQSRAFAEGKVDEKKLSREMKKGLNKLGDVLDNSASNLREGIIINSIVNQTLRNHVSKGYLRPNGWVILGHSSNRQKLRRDYEK